MLFAQIYSTALISYKILTTNDSFVLSILLYIGLYLSLQKMYLLVGKNNC